MKREIKFRAYTDLGIMIENFCFLGDDNHFQAEDLTNTHYGNITSVMQFTGMLDSSGKEIFEGDIVKYSQWNTRDGLSPMGNDNFKYGKVYFDRDGFQVEGNEGYNTFNYQHIYVVGNIHQNPGLCQS